MTRGPKKVPAPSVPTSHRGILRGAGQPVRATGQETQLGIDETRSVPRSKSAQARETLAQRLVHAEASLPPRAYDAPHSAGYDSTHLAHVFETGGLADAGGQPPALGQAARGLEPRTQTPLSQTAPAPALPVTALGANIRTTLSRAAPECAAILFEHINRLSNLARYAESNQLLAESMMASNLAGRLAIKTIEMTVGKQLNVTATITGQSSIPKWDKLTKEQQAYYKRMSEELAQLPEPDVTAQVVEGIVVPQTDEGYQEDTYGSPSAT